MFHYSKIYPLSILETIVSMHSHLTAYCISGISSIKDVEIPIFGSPKKGPIIYLICNELSVHYEKMPSTSKRLFWQIIGHIQRRQY